MGAGVTEQARAEQVAEPNAISEPVVLARDDTCNVLIRSPLVEEGAIEGVYHANPMLTRPLHQVEAFAVG